MTKPYNARSFSLPPRSHPTLLKTEEHLNNLKKSMERSSSPSPSPSKPEELSSALSSLGDLYGLTGDVFTLSLTQEALLSCKHNNNEKWVNEFLEGLLKYLDICGNARDAVVLTKESVRELQSALRRSKCGETTIVDDVSKYVSTRKKIKKEAAKTLVSLKQMDNAFGSDMDPGMANGHLSLVLRMLRETSFVTSWVFQSLLSYISVPKPTKWSLLVHKLMMHKRVGVLEGKNGEVNELDSADVALSNILMMQQVNGEKMIMEKIESANLKLEALDGVIGRFEEELECLFRILIHVRVSLLNVLSQ